MYFLPYGKIFYQRNNQMKRIAFILLLIMAWAHSDAQMDTVVYPTNFSKKLNVEYAKVNDWVGLVDIYFNTTNPTPTPIVINIHGGGWNKGSKETQRGFGRSEERRVGKECGSGGSP